MADRRTALYRYYDADGRLLYVGITFNPSQRRSAHVQWSSWWGKVVRHAVEWYDTRDLARAAEVAAIAAEEPLHNRADTPHGRSGGAATVRPRKSRRPVSPGIHAQVAAYRAAKKKFDAARDALISTALAEMADGVWPMDIADATGWSRDEVRRLKKKADEAAAD